MEDLKDIQQISEYSDFMGYATYRTTLSIKAGRPAPRFISPGKSARSAS